jgi:hypothetical protein
MSSTAPVPEVFSRFFLADDAPMGQTWLLSTLIPLSEAALHHLAQAWKVPLIAKARNVYGHFRKASQMNKVPGRYWKPEPDLTTFLEQTSQLLNPQYVIVLSTLGSYKQGSPGDSTICSGRNCIGALHYSGGGGTSHGHSWLTG